MSATDRIGRLLRLAAETGGALTLVLALFWLFILLLYSAFPSGTRISELFVESGERPAARGGGRRPEAALNILVRDVRCRRGDSVAWGDAREGMLLFNNDAVQTFDRSGATISFAPGDRLVLGSNSMLVVTRLNEGVEGAPRAYRVHAEGELAGTFSASKGVTMEVAAAGHLARVVPGRSRFRFTPVGLDAASLAVYSGEVRLPGEGRTIRVPADFGIVLRRGVPAGAPVPLPAPPALKDADLLYRFRALPPKVRFAWAGQGGAYHFQLSGESRFRTLVLDRKLSASSFEAGTLEAGNYYWRVSRIEDGREGRFSRTGRCRLLQELAPPPLSVAFPPKEVAVGLFSLSGVSRPGCRVYVNGVETQADGSGAFRRELVLEAGVNLIRVEAVDETGNASYASRVVYGKEEVGGR